MPATGFAGKLSKGVQPLDGTEEIEMTAKRTTRSSASAGPAANEQLATMTAWQGDALNAATRAGQAYAQGLFALNQ